jgi:hypothetical protein
MSGSSDRKKQFLLQHPYCCFCGGQTPSSEPDHIPSRAFFAARQWPEGYVFPACVSCNRATRHDEQVVAMLSRLYPDFSTETEKAEFEKLVRAIARNYPAIIEEMRPRHRQVRNAMKTYGLTKAPGQSMADMPVLAVNGPLVNAAVERFSCKLFCALFYKHSGNILPVAGGIAVRWFSNLQIQGEEIPRSIASVLQGFPKLKRSRMNLGDQFFYRWGIADTRTVAGFLAFFRRSFAIVGYLNVDISDFELPEHARIVRPFTKA